MANTSLALLIDQKAALGIADPSTRGGRELLRMLINHLESIASGNKQANNIKLWIDGARPQRASATLALSSASGDVGGDINGVSVLATYATSDANTAGLVAAAINASTDPLVQYLVQASNWAATIALSNAVAGNVVDIFGYKFTARSGGVLRDDEFDISSTDTNDAVSLKNQINNRAGLRDIVLASSSSGTVTIRQWAGSSAAGTLTKSGSPITVSGPSAGATVLVSSLAPGITGNTITLVANGTGVTASAARLAGGTGMNVAIKSINPSSNA